VAGRVEVSRVQDVQAVMVREGVSWKRVRCGALHAYIVLASKRRGEQVWFVITTTRQTTGDGRWLYKHLDCVDRLTKLQT
jgi:hypothetical protein